MLRYNILSDLRKNKEETIYGLSKKLQRSTSVIVYELDCLEGYGLVYCWDEDGRKPYRLTDLGRKVLDAAECMQQRGEELAISLYGKEIVDLVKRVGIIRPVEKFVPTREVVTGCGFDYALRDAASAPFKFLGDVVRSAYEALRRAKLTCPKCGYSFNVPLVLPGPAPFVCPSYHRSLMLHTYESMWSSNAEQVEERSRFQLL
jgi:DNA-binding PadR family transcriptional regulator